MIVDFVLPHLPDTPTYVPNGSVQVFCTWKGGDFLTKIATPREPVVKPAWANTVYAPRAKKPHLVPLRWVSWSNTTSGRWRLMYVDTKPSLFGPIDRLRSKLGFYKVLSRARACGI